MKRRPAARLPLAPMEGPLGRQGKAEEQIAYVCGADCPIYKINTQIEYGNHEKPITALLDKPLYTQHTNFLTHTQPACYPTQLSQYLHYTHHHRTDPSYTCTTQHVPSPSATTIHDMHGKNIVTWNQRQDHSYRIQGHPFVPIHYTLHPSLFCPNAQVVILLLSLQLSNACPLH